MTEYPAPQTSPSLRKSFKYHCSIPVSTVLFPAANFQAPCPTNCTPMQGSLSWSTPRITSHQSHPCFTRQSHLQEQPIAASRVRRSSTKKVLFPSHPGRSKRGISLLYHVKSVWNGKQRLVELSVVQSYVDSESAATMHVESRVSTNDLVIS